MIILACILCVLLALIVIALLVTIYHQMLMLNEINKRLMVITEDSIDNERNTMDAFNQRLQEDEASISDKFDSGATTTSNIETSDTFNPHEALDDLD